MAHIERQSDQSPPLASLRPPIGVKSPGQPVVTIANGQFIYAVPHPKVPGKATPAYPATMAEDGSFTGEIIAGTISGQVQGTRIEGRIDGSACLYAFAGNRM